MRERSRARGWAVQALYAWESRGGTDEAIVPTLAELADNLRISPRNLFYAEVLVRMVARQREAIDRMIQKHLINWNLVRLSVVDRNILRIGVAELMFIEDVPSRVTVREMIRLAERYGTPESPRFVNGVLDGVLKDVEAQGT